MDVWLNGYYDDRMYGWMKDVWMYRCIYGCMEVSMEECIDVWMYGLQYG